MSGIIAYLAFLSRTGSVSSNPKPTVHCTSLHQCESHTFSFPFVTYFFPK